MVQLKVGVKEMEKAFDINFNSTMVQLKGGYNFRKILNCDKFQFHNGSIKSILYLLSKTSLT